MWPRARFRQALETVLNEKQMALGVPGHRFSEFANKVYDEVRPPFFRRMCEWIKENWQTILSIILTIAPLFL